MAYLLRGVERLQFADKNIALDLDRHAGQVAKVLGAVFGASSLTNTEYVGIGLDLLHGGMSYEALVTLADSVTEKTSSSDICEPLWTNVIGSAPSTQGVAPSKTMLDSGQLSVGQLTVLAADTSSNTQSIDLVGLSATGIEFI